MYAAYQADGPARSTIRTTTFVKDEDFYGDNSDHSNDFRGRLLSYCVAGTFGLLSPTYLLASSATANWNINQIEIGNTRASTTNGVSAAAADLARIRAILKVSVSELARVFGVSRQAVHEWIKGGALSPQNAERLSELTQVADMFLESGIEVTTQMLRRKVGGDMSLLESVKEHGKVVDQARTLLGTLSREAQQRQRLAARLAGRQKPALTPDDFGAPHLSDDA